MIRAIIIPLLVFALILTLLALWAAEAHARSPHFKVIAPDEACPADTPHEVIMINETHDKFKLCAEDVK